MPLTRSVPDDGCWRSATTRNIVVLPQPDGPIKETNSPSAICRLTLDSASTRPSAVSNVSEMSLISTTVRPGEDAGEGVAVTGVRDDTFWSGRCLIVGSL